MPDRAETLVLGVDGAPLTVATTPALTIQPEDDPMALAEAISEAAVVAVAFPSFADGRGFSHARTMRERLDYRGDIRAVGHVIADQYVFLVRCGFSSVAVRADRQDTWRAALRQISIALQPAHDDRGLTIAGPTRAKRGLDIAAE